jgi:flagella basal body P-ring formation protein FlgA
VMEGLPAASLQLAGAKEIVVQPLTMVLKPSDVTEAAEPVLLAALGHESHGDIEHELVAPLKAERVPPGRRSFDLRAQLHDGRVSYNSATIDVAVLVDGEVYKTLSVPYRLRRFGQIVVARKPIRRGAPLDEENVEVRRMEAAMGTSMLVTALAAVENKVAARDIQGGQSLRLGDVAEPALIRKGAPVSLVSSSGRVKVTTRAIALGDAPIGGRVAVQSLTSQQVVQGVVRGVGVVIVMEGKQ